MRSLFALAVLARDRLDTAERVRDFSATTARHARDVVPAFGANLDLLQRPFELGEIDIIEVSVGLQAFLDAQKAALDAWESYLVALRELELALGRELDWAPALR